MNIYFYFYVNIARDVVTSLLIFVDIYHFNHTFSHAHIGTNIQAYMNDQHTEGMVRTMHRNLLGRSGSSL